jgi:hypothetical protein
MALPFFSNINLKPTTMTPTWLYHKTRPAQIFDADTFDIGMLYDDGWRDSPAHPDLIDPPESEDSTDTKPTKPAKK